VFVIQHIELTVVSWHHHCTPLFSPSTDHSLILCHLNQPQSICISCDPGLSKVFTEFQSTHRATFWFLCRVHLILMNWWLEVIRHFFQPLRNIDCSKSLWVWVLITMELFSGTLLSCDTCNAGSSTGRHFSAFLIVASKDFFGISFKTCKHLFTGQILPTVPPWLHLSQVYLESWSSTVRHPVQLISCL
jgi:hypothetical protein